MLVSSLWRPPICCYCKEISHVSTKCKLAPIICPPCNSTTHGPHNYPKAKVLEGKGRKTRRAKPKEKQWAVVDPKSLVPPEQTSDLQLGTDFVIGECSKTQPTLPTLNGASRSAGSQSDARQVLNRTLQTLNLLRKRKAIFWSTRMTFNLCAENTSLS